VAITTKLKTIANRGLHKANVHFDSYTAERRELARLDSLARAGHFERPVFPITEAMARTDPTPVLAAVCSLVRAHRPARVLEVGCGNSTRILRLAIRDGSLSTHLTAIDPHPRVEITALCDEMLRQRAELLAGTELFDALDADDILFIDSSHELKPGNDVIFLYLQVLPRLRPGVLVHIHDIFLPYEYPSEWIAKERWPWNEQYLVQAMLAFGSAFEVLWPGYYLQRTLPGFARLFPHLGLRRAQSLWLRKT
jgi:predicted O-methyltransferase YrrM